MTAMHRGQIAKLAAKISNDPPGSPGYLSAYSRARCKVGQGLKDNQRQKYKAMAKEWSEKRLPKEMQQRYVHGNDSSGLELTDFSELA